MQFDSTRLKHYQDLLQTTDLIESYQEFIRLFRFLRIELEKELPQYKFQGNIVENAMDYSYFQFTTPDLKNKGLKLVIAFVHRTFSFEVWLSGYNRKYQCETHALLSKREQPYFLGTHPAKQDYILSTIMPQPENMADGEALVQVLKKESLQLIQMCEETL